MPENYTISFSQEQFNKATKTNNDALEDIAYCIAFANASGRNRTDLIRQVLEPYKYKVDRSSVHVMPSVEFLCQLYNLFRKEEADTIIQIHWHKFCSHPSFSFQDDECAQLALKDILRINKKARLVQVVFGDNSEHFKARWIDKNKKFNCFNNIKVIGPQGITKLCEKEPDESSSNTINKKVFEKNIMTFGKKGMKKISSIKAVVIGAGGIGSGLLYQMLRIGFENVSIIDFDIIEANNCNRLYFAENPKTATGKLKVKLIKNAFRRFNPKARLCAYRLKAEDKRIRAILKKSELIILAVDNDGIRAVINSFAARYSKPLVNVASGIVMNDKGDKIQSAGIQIQWFLPGEPEYPCLRCHGLLNEEEIQHALMDHEFKSQREKAGYIHNTQQSPAPQVMPLNTVAAGMAMWEIVSWVIGAKQVKPWINYDVMKNKFMAISVSQKLKCSVCSPDETSLLATGDYEQKIKQSEFGKREKSQRKANFYLTEGVK